MKKLLSLVLAVIMAAMVAVPGFAAADKCTCGETPSVYVAALGSGSVILDEGTENERTLFRPSTESIIQIVLKVLPALVKVGFTMNLDHLGDALIESVNDAFGAMALDGNGNSAKNVI